MLSVSHLCFTEESFGSGEMNRSTVQSEGAGRALGTRGRR